MRLCLLLALLAPAALAQPQARGFALPAEALASDTLCTYDACALRVETRFFSGPQLVRGADGTRVAGVGLFGTDLSAVVGASEAALPHAEAYDRLRVPVALTTLGALGLLATGAVLQAEAARGDDTTAFVVTMGGFALTITSASLSAKAQRSFSRAVWHYNRDLPR